MVEVKLIRPLDGKPEGSIAEYPEADAKRLQARGLLKIIGKAPAPKTKDAAPPENKAEVKTAKKAD